MMLLTYHYDIPEEICTVILNYFQKFNCIRSLIQLSSVSSIFRESINKIITTIEILDKDIMRFLKDDQLKMFKNLKILDLSGNKVITGQAIKKMDLHTLYLANNKIIIDDDIKGMKGLHTLDLSWNDKITDNGIKDLPLRALFLYYNNRITKEGIKSNLLRLYINSVYDPPFSFMANQTEEICVLAVQRYGDTLKYVKDQFKTENICKLAVQQDGYALPYVKKRFKTEEICKLAVQQNGYALKYVKNKTEDICKLAVQYDGYALQFVK